MPIIMPSPGSGKEPKIHESVFIAPSAIIIGDVEIGEGSNIWFNVVLRGEWAPIRIGRNTSIQESVTIHSEKDKFAIIGSDCIIGHHAMIHGPCEIEDGCLVGIGSNVLHNSKLGKGSLLAAGAVLVNKEIPPKSLVVGVPAKIKQQLPDEDILVGAKTSGTYVEKGRLFKEFFEENPEIIRF
jgi:carbonic anhydrase/acetyltransferase-like protein (isoleucine patch superfamily)